MKMHRARYAIGLMIAAAALVLSACGTSDKDKYKTDASKIINPLNDQITAAAPKISAASTPQAFVTAVEGMRKSVAGAATKLDKLDPPGSVKKEHDTFVQQLQTFGGDLQTAEDAAQSKDKAKLQAVGGKLKQDASTLKQANDALKAKVE